MGSTGSGGSVLTVVNLNVLHRLLGLDLGSRGRGERHGAEVEDAADYDGEYSCQGQPLSARPSRARTRSSSSMKAAIMAR